MTPGKIRTASGQAFWPWLLKGEIRIGDIAQALSNICRFYGHTSKFYSVAEHSVRVSKMVPPEDALAGLLHDAAEAYIGDIAKPLKVTHIFAAYRGREAILEEKIFEHFGLEPKLPDSVHRADREACKQEGSLLIPGWEDQPLSPTFPPVIGLAPQLARALFLQRYEELTNGNL